MTQVEDRAVALAGIVQACAQVQALARTGELNQRAYDSSVQSVLILDAVNTPAVFGGIQGVSSGLGLLADGLLSSAAVENVELLRYAMSLIHLQHQLYRNEHQYARFGQAVEQLSAYADEELVTACSDVYQQFISDMRPQIIVQGEQGFLQRTDVPPRIRALLLAGLRAAVLWQQKGGGRFKMVWERNKYRRIAINLLEHG